MKKKIVITLIILILATVVYAANVKWTALAELTTVADADVLCIVDDVAGTPTSKKITVLNLFDTIDTFAELNTIVADKTLVNEEDAVTWDALGTFALGVTITTGDPLTLGANRIDNGSDLLDGEMIAADTIDDDSIDWADVTGVDITLTDAGAITSSGVITATTSVITPLLDAAGAEDMDYGSVDVTDHTFVTDGTGTAEIVLPAGSIDGTEILDDTVDSGDYAADSIDNEHINWADIDNLGDEGAITVADTTDATSFVALWESATGDLAAKSDGALLYAADTGTLAATEFSGGGASLTSVDAATGDSATAFFDAGTIEHEYGGIEADISAIADGGVLVGTGAGTMAIRASFLTAGAAGFIKHELGGLEADINAYTGLVAITGGSTAEVDSKSELEGHIADVADFAEADGDTYTGAHDFGGATSVEIPNGTDPDVDAAGEITNDTDGANETGDVIIRAFDGTNQFPAGRKLKTLSFTLIEPDGIDAADLIPIWHNTSGMTFTIVEWKAWSDDDDVSLEIEELTDPTDYTAITTVDAVEIATDGTGVFYASDSTITHAAIEHDHSLAIDFDTSDTPDYVQISITGWFNADVD